MVEMNHKKLIDMLENLKKMVQQGKYYRINSEINKIISFVTEEAKDEKES